MKKVLYVISVLFIAFFMTSCGNRVDDLKDSNDTTRIFYKNTRYGFTLAFPEQWENKYGVEDANNTVKIYHKATWIETGQGTLFTIWIFDSREKWNSEGKELEEMIGLKKIFESDNYVYGCSFPTDVQNISDDIKFKDEYKLMEKDVATIIKTFKKD